MPNVKLKMLRALEGRPLEVDDLPAYPSRGICSAFALVSKRSLARAELLGELTAYKIGRDTCYERSQFLQWVGIPVPAPASAVAVPATPASVATKRLGRPKGSRNKPKLVAK
jgi:hypothetical protein